MSVVSAAAWLSSLCLAVMIVFDRLMVGDCYRNQPNQAWLVSSVGGSAIGLVATMISWTYVSMTSGPTLQTLLQTLVELAYPHGVLMAVAGAIAVQVLYHYFHAFISKDGLEVNETAIAMWLASSPVWIFASVVLIQYSDLPLYNLTGLDKAEASWQFGTLMLLSVVGLVCFELAGQQGKNGLWTIIRSRYIRSILFILVFTVAYTLILSGVTRSFDDNLTETLALLPWYFLGFAAGLRILFSKTDRIKLRNNWRRLRKFGGLILVAEIVGALVFFLEFFALSGLDPTLVNMIIAAHVIPVFLMNVGLGKLRLNMQRNNVQRYRFMGMRFLAHKLPRAKESIIPETAWLVLVLATLSLGIYYAR